MSSLKFKTSDNSSPQGKPRIYFCCHPDDFSRHFDSLSKEISAKCSCAFYYADSETVRDEDFYSDLGQMQLFVVPVTTDFLLTENDALAKEFAFATNSHIPVLPIMLQQGLTDVFNEKCGDLQFLDKSTVDETALSYDEKLESFLKSVIIGDKLAQKVRDNFDGYMFLSYRKKDRRLARKLMQLIHKSEPCKKFAIWYDEFLVPGENFNSSIKNALDKSDLFVLAVTPNLVNENNYIMQHEYPMARDRGKPIFPAEMQSTSKLKLSMKYRGIPSCTSADDEETFAARLESAVKDLDIPPKQDTPESRYLLGLAYLGGIDVEVDYKKAEELITSAAQENHIDAIIKLSDMYSHGTGVSRSYIQASQWLDRLTDIYLDMYKKDKSVKTVSALCSAIIKNGELCFRMRMTEHAIKKYALCLNLLVDNSKNYSKNLYTQAVHCCNRLGDLYVSKKRYDEALDCFNKGFDFSYKITSNDFDTKMLQDGFRFHKKTGDVYLKQNKTEQAEKIYKTVLASVTSLENDFSTNRHRENRYEIFLSLGQLYTSAGKYSDALSAFISALDIAGEIYKHNPSPRNRMITGSCYFYIADMYAKMGRIDSAVDSYQKYFDSYSELIQDEKSPGYHNSMRNLYIGYGRLGDLLLENGRTEDAYGYHTKAFDAEKQLAIMSRNALTIKKLIDRIIYTAKKYMAKKLDVQARLMFLEAEKYFETLKHYLTDDEHLLTYATIELNLGDIHNRTQMPFAAKKNYQKYADTYAAYADRTHSVFSFFNASLGYKRLGEIYSAENSAYAAAEFYLKAAQQLERIPPQELTPKYILQLAKNYEALGDVYLKEKRYADSRIYCDKNVALRQQLFDADPSDAGKNSLALALYKTALTGADDMKELLLKSQQLYFELHQADPADAIKLKNYNIVHNKIKSLYG